MQEEELTGAQRLYIGMLLLAGALIFIFCWLKTVAYEESHTTSSRTENVTPRKD